MNREIIFLSAAEALRIHDEQVKLFGGKAGVRDMGLLESALDAPRSGFGDHYFHDDLFKMAAAYMFHVAKNHPFLDGNKRTATALALVFLVANGVHPQLAQERVLEIALQVAQTQLPKDDLATVFRLSAE